MAAITTRLPAVAIEYAGAKNKRVTKKFKDAYEAKSFYRDMFAASKEPAVKGEHPQVADITGTAPDEESTRLDTAVAAAVEASPAPATAGISFGVASATEAKRRLNRGRSHLAHAPAAVTMMEHPRSIPLIGDGP